MFRQCPEWVLFTVVTCSYIVISESYVRMYVHIIFYVIMYLYYNNFCNFVIVIVHYYMYFSFNN